MKKDIARHVAQCDTCQRMKIEHQRPVGKLQPLKILEWKWEHVTMNFVMGLTKGSIENDIIWVIVDRLMKFSHFLPMKMGQPVSKLA